MSNVTSSEKNNCGEKEAAEKTIYKYTHDKPISWEYSSGKREEKGLTLKGLGLQDTGSMKTTDFGFHLLFTGKNISHAIGLMKRFSSLPGSADWHPTTAWIIKVGKNVGLEAAEKLGEGAEEVWHKITSWVLPSWLKKWFETPEEKIFIEIEDEDFAFQRVGGVNPCMLRKVLPKDENFEKLIFNSEEPDREKYYVTDYSSLKMLEDNDHSAANSEGRKERLVYFPKALFKANNNHLEPVAIQVRRCANGSTESELVLKGAKKWEIAKYIVQNADINYHELVTHLGRTHLYVEAFAVAAGMCLPKDSHPLSILLRPHFEGTININDFATTDLINTSSEIEHGGVFDLNFSGTMESNVKLIAQEAFGISPDGKKDQNFFNKNLFPRDIKRRGFGHFNELKLADHNEAVYILKAYSWKKDKDDLNFSYPYLEDACELWNAITQWVAGYVCVHYTSNAAVLDDCALQAWAKTVVEQGNILGFGEYDEDKKTTVAGEIYTRTYLIQAITSIIFTASVQHAAVNFPQADYGATLPAGIYYDFFKDNNPDITPYLPNKDQFEAVMNVLQLLSSVRYTKLGEYHPNTSDPIPKPEVYFANDTAVCDHLQEFNNRLKEIETMIEKREGADTGKPSEPGNRKYHYLRPSKIPQSINI